MLLKKKTYSINIANIKSVIAGESPVLVVMGGESYSKGCGFESQHHKRDGHFSH